MNGDSFYFSLQYSAIQKTVLRHDRLWSMAGISQIMAWMNEIEMPRIVKENSGSVLVAGGGKFTAKFDNKKKSETAKEEIIKLISTTLPMLEFQFAEIKSYKDMVVAREAGIFESLNEQKKRFRGYGVSYNPHFRICPECGEYPSINRPEPEAKKDKYEYERTKEFCSICLAAFWKARIEGEGNAEMTTIERIYKKFFQSEVFKNINKQFLPEIPLNFKNLFPDEKEKEKGVRMAVWFSDLNSMNQKVPIWLSQCEDEKEDVYSIPRIFSMIKDVNIDIISETLAKTFTTPGCKYLPFRLIVAGGDDLRIVMAEEYIFDFIENLSGMVEQKIKQINTLPKYIPLSKKWLQEQANKWAKENQDNKKEIPKIKSYSFGGSFVVTSLHTPFKKIHEACEEMMSEAKRKTNREGNSVNWSVLSVEENPDVKKMLRFEKPLLIEEEYRGKHDNTARLSFKQYIAMRNFYSGILSGSHIQQIASKIIEFKNDSKQVEDWLKKAASAELEKSFAYVLVDKNFRKDRKEDEDFMCERLSTLLELLSISRKGVK